MRGLLRQLAVALLGAGAALLVACGDTTGLLDRSDAETLRNDIDKVAAAVEDGNCDEAVQALARAQRDFGALPDDVDPRLKSKLAAGLENFAAKVPEECATNATETTPTTPEETTPTTPPETTPTTPPETTPPETTPPETTPPETTPAETTPGSGGQTAPAP